MSTETFTVLRTFPVPAARLWAIWTQPAHIAASSAPPGGSFESPTFELRPGGRHHYCARTAEGQETWGLRSFVAIEEGTRLQWRQSFSDATGTPARHPMAPSFPLTLLSTLTFADDGAGGAQLTLTWEPVDATPEERAFFAAIHEGMRGGWTHTFDQVEQYARAMTEG